MVSVRFRQFLPKVIQFFAGLHERLVDDFVLFGRQFLAKQTGESKRETVFLVQDLHHEARRHLGVKEIQRLHQFQDVARKLLLFWRSFVVSASRGLFGRSDFLGLHQVNGAGA